MRIFILLISSLILTACDSDSSSDKSSYSFEEIIEHRLNDNEDFNGKELLITGNLGSSFGLACPAVVYLPCTDEPDDISGYVYVDEYGHAGNSTGPTCDGAIHLVTEDRSIFEALIIDLVEHTDFFIITSQNEVVGSVLATVEFTDEINHCDKKIYKGTKITPSQGEHQGLLDLFIN